MVRRLRNRYPPSKARGEGTGKTSSYRGHELKVPPQPPEFTSRPWWPLIVRIDSPATTVGLNSVLGSLRTQLGFPVDLSIAVRLQTIRVWSPLVSFSAGPITPLNVAFREFIQDTVTTSGTPANVGRVIEQYTRYPDQVNRACVGFCYSLAHQSITLMSGGTSDVDLLNLSGAGTGSVVYVKLLFRTGIVSPAALGSVATAVPTKVPSNWDERDSDSEVEVISVTSRRTKK